MQTHRALVLLNKKSGTLAFSEGGNPSQQIVNALAAGGILAELNFIDPSKAAEAIARRRPDCHLVIVGGGDGTINAVASAVANRPRQPNDPPLALGVLPLGTHNHFSKELGMPEELDAALAALAAAAQSPSAYLPLDVAEVNGRLFLNFSGVGLHPLVVARREVEHVQMKRFALLRSVLKKFTKPAALAVAFIRLMQNLPILRLSFDADGKRHRRVTPSVIVCTNAHQIELLGLTEVSSPSRDRLNVYVARTSRVVGTVLLMLAALTRRLKAMREFETLAPKELTVYYRRPTMVVSLDGELVRLRTPLRYRIRHSALTVLRPIAIAPIVADDPVPAAPLI